ncbi:o-succinylbenzoate synthase [Flavobacterium stagni]|uniref:O-succinylbenzoate synthase n=1 Tax=Flavobacterium stagni TaxID=2506421 RepID=A0A4Q1K874_9FLAO|nr:o-succinylbenzoate synthase [Flavobacterium stagni]RXR21496.1 o-succinylbenzoate synthase [Flavobacterium stagni]
MEANFVRYLMNFNVPVGTSRGEMEVRETWFLFIKENGRLGMGECGMLKGLSCDDRPEFLEKLQWVCDHIEMGETALYEAMREYPSIQFGIEQAFLSFYSPHPGLLFPSAFTAGKESIPINGLLWMGKPTFIRKQFDEKVTHFPCVKMKVGALNFQSELDLLTEFRAQYPPDQLEIRLDANGAFTPENVEERLAQLAEFSIHSIEQPIRPKQFDLMRDLCQMSPIPIALDEELIGIFDREDKEKLLDTIQPQYIILKPSFVGGFRGSQEWIDLANERNIGWWITSALESNVGLNAIAQWTYTLGSSMAQGLGTGSLYLNNFQSPLTIKEGHLWHHDLNDWDAFVWNEKSN